MTKYDLLQGMSIRQLAFRLAAFAIAAVSLAMAPDANAGSAKAEFKVAVRANRALHVSTAPIKVAEGKGTGLRSSILLQIPRDEHVRLRIELTSPAVQSVEIVGLGRAITIGREPVEIITPPREPGDAAQHLVLTYIVKYHEGTSPYGETAPIRMVIIP